MFESGVKHHNNNPNQMNLFVTSTSSQSSFQNKDMWGLFSWKQKCLF